MSDAPLFLIGLRGSGKSTIARLLAHELGWNWLDADDELEKHYGQSIRAIFATEGEPSFREKESAILAQLCRLPRYIIATGGGIVLREDNRALLRSSGRIVWLTADIDTLWQRVQADSATAERRPPLTVGGRAEMEEIIRLREPLYRQCAENTVDTSRRKPNDIVAEILRWMSESR
jgi:shikimate kinase